MKASLFSVAENDKLLLKQPVKHFYSSLILF